MNSVEVKIEGLEGIEKKLKQLPANYIKRGLRRAIRKGANVIRDDARTNAKSIDDPATREAIYKNIAVAGGGASREKRAGGPIMRIGVRGGARYNKGADGLPGGNTSGHWRFVEFGTAKQKAQPFMRNAIVTGAEKALNVTAAASQVELDKEISKLNVL